MGIYCCFDEFFVDCGMIFIELSVVVGVSIVNFFVLKNDCVCVICYLMLCVICEVLDCEVGDLFVFVLC